MRTKPMLLAAFFLVLVAVAVYKATTGAALPKVAAMPSVGDPAPDFALPDQDGTVHRLSDYKGKTLLIAFYPADFTPGCSVEAHAMVAVYPKFTDASITPIGVSVQSSKSHQAFCHSFDIPYPLLADTQKTMSADYGVLETGAFGGTAKRVTFIVDGAGKIVYIDDHVDSHLMTCATDWLTWARKHGY